MWRLGGGGLDDAPPLDNVAPTLAQVHLLGRRPGPLSFRCGRPACDVALSTVLGRLLCKSRLRLFPLNTTSVVRSVVTPTASALGLFPRGVASTREVGAPIRDAPGRVSAVTLLVSEALAALTLQRAFRRHVRLNRHSQAAEFDE
jgi:hypothetical protein